MSTYYGSNYTENWAFSVTMDLVVCRPGRGVTRPVNKQFEGVINAVIRVTIQLGFACCLCIICTSDPVTLIGVLVLT